MAKKYCAHILIVIFLLISSMVFSTNKKDQVTDFKFEHISIAQGLSQSTVYCVLQDSKGFMWFGTQNGLNRYDGNTFKLYDYDPKNPNSLSNNLVLSICEDRKGMIWVGTWGGGLNKFDPKTEKFAVYKSNSKIPNSLSDDNINTIYEDRSSALWIGTDIGINKFDPAKNSFTHYLKEIKKKDEFQHNRVNFIYQDQNNTLWIGTDNGLFKYDEKNSNFIRYSNCSGGSNACKIRAILEDKKGDFWVGSEEGLYFFDRINETFTLTDNSSLNKENINSIYECKTGLLWIGTRENGIYVYNSQNKAKTYHYDKKTNDPDSLSHNEVKSIYEDKSGLIWIGTNGGGLNKYDPKREKFTLYRDFGDDPKKPIGNNDITAICESKTQKNGIWIGTRNGGICLFNTVTQNASSHLISDKISKNQLRNDIRALCEDRFGKLWVGTERAGLYIFDIEKKEFDLFEKINTSAHILSIYEDRSGILWVGTMDDGLIQIDMKREVSENFKNIPGDVMSLSDNKVFSICEDETELLWIGTGNGGLNRFDKKKNSFRRFLPSAIDPGSISYNFISAIYEDTEGTLWIGTGGGGLNKLIDREKGEFKAYRKTDGLPDNVIYAILEDEENNLWLSANKGLSRFDPKTGEFRNYTVRDGLQDYEFNRGAACKPENSKELYFGGVKGFNAFNPKDFKSNSSAPPIVITSFKKYNQEVKLDTSISETKQLNLSYSDYSISFEFAVLDFSDPENNRYEYKLEPDNKKWITLGNKHELTFPKLEPGEYTFRVRGSNNEGVMNEAGASVKIIVSTPFTSTWLFRILLILFVGGVIFGLVRWRIKDIEKKRKEIKDAYDKLQESEERYRTLVETSPDAITLCDIKGKIIMANQQTAILLGYNNLEEMKPHVRTIFHSITLKDRARARENAKNVIKSGVATNVGFTLRAKDGTEITAEISTSIIKNADETPRYFLAITRDIRERKEAEEKDRILMEAEKMVSLGTLVSGVAHEINNPASIIMTNTEVFSTVWKNIAPILDQYELDNENFSIANIPYKDIKKQLEDSLNSILDSSRRIKIIIQELKNYSRSEDPLTRQVANINEIVRSSLKLTNDMIKKATNKFLLELDENLPAVWGNYQRLEQVFINLIQNACQALPDSSLGIFISTSYDKKNNLIVVKVKDEGVGISEESMKHISDPFFTTKRTSGGTGLGISISNRIIQEHGGQIKFESKVGKGTTVSVFLPVKPLKENAQV